VNNGFDQVNAWKDDSAANADGAEHPAGKVNLPKRRRSHARSAALGGYATGGLAIAAGMIVPTLSDTCTG
jgi:hypothetical protein